MAGSKRYTPEAKALGEVVRAARGDDSCAKFGRVLGVSGQTIIDIERGKPPSSELLKRICDERPTHARELRRAFVQIHGIDPDDLIDVATSGRPSAETDQAGSSKLDNRYLARFVDRGFSDSPVKSLFLGLIEHADAPSLCRVLLRVERDWSDFPPRWERELRAALLARVYQRDDASVAAGLFLLAHLDTAVSDVDLGELMPIANLSECPLTILGTSLPPEPAMVPMLQRVLDRMTSPKGVATSYALWLFRVVSNQPKLLSADELCRVWRWVRCQDQRNYHCWIEFTSMLVEVLEMPTSTDTMFPDGLWREFCNDVMQLPYDEWPAGGLPHGFTEDDYDGDPADPVIAFWSDLVLPLVASHHPGGRSTIEYGLNKLLDRSTSDDFERCFVSWAEVSLDLGLVLGSNLSLLIRALQHFSTTGGPRLTKDVLLAAEGLNTQLRKAGLPDMPVAIGSDEKVPSSQVLLGWKRALRSRASSRVDSH